MTTVKITRIGTAIVDNVPTQQFNNAVKRGNIVDDIIIINDIPYQYSSVDFSSSGSIVPEIIKIGSMTFADLNASPGVTFVTKIFVNAKPAGKRVVTYYTKIKIPFAGVGTPAIGFAQVVSANLFYGASNPIPNTAGFIQTYPTVSGAMSPTNSSVQADMRMQINTVSNVPPGNLYTAGEMECYIEVVNIPDAVVTPPALP